MTLTELRHRYRTDPLYFNTVNALVRADCDQSENRDFNSLVATEFWSLRVSYLGRDTNSVFLLNPDWVEKTKSGWQYGYPDYALVEFEATDVLVLHMDLDLTPVRSTEQLLELDTTLFQQQMPTIWEFIGDRKVWVR